MSESSSRLRSSGAWDTTVPLSRPASVLCSRPSFTRLWLFTLHFPVMRFEDLDADHAIVQGLRRN